MITEFTAQIIGLEEDLEKENQKIKKQANYALTEVGVELVRDLQAILKKEWYSKYNPTVYERRTDDDSLGTPLGSLDNFDETFTDPATQTLHFVYNPTGGHINPEWNDRSGDDLIKWLQQEHNYAETEDGEILRTIPARPFWNIFIREQENGGIMNKFIKAMSPEYKVISDGTDDIDLSDSLLPEGEVKVHTI